MRYICTSQYKQRYEEDKGMVRKAVRKKRKGARRKRRSFLREKKIFCGKEYLEVDIIPVTNIPESGRKKKKESTQKQKNLNEKRSRRRFVQVANANFKKGDLHITATYSERNLPQTLGEAERNAHNFLDKIRRLMKKELQQELKYMLVTEYTMQEAEGQQGAGSGQQETDGRDKPVRIHHHFIINGGLDRDAIELLWSRTRINWKKAQDPEYRDSVDMLGFVNCDRLKPDENGLEALVNYMNKRKKGCKKWSTSRNLKKPVERKNDHKFSFKKLRELAQTPEDKEYWARMYKGYDPVSIRFAYNEHTGWSVYLKLRKTRGMVHEDRVDRCGRP